jgi:hypothetical protein
MLEICPGLSAMLHFKFLLVFSIGVQVVSVSLIELPEEEDGT